MNHLMSRVHVEGFASGLCHPVRLSDSDVLETLTNGLGPAWVVSCETDYERAVSIVVLPADLEVSLSFLLYEEGNEIVVATLLSDEWTEAQSVVTFSQAADLLITKTKIWTGLLKVS